jgi:hypothetical protein
MRQYAPWPTELEAAVAELRYEPGWTFSLEDIERDHDDVHGGAAGGLTFVIYVPCQDSYHPERYRPVHHYHPVPAATFNRLSWERWLFDRLADTVRHEMAEWFRFEAVAELDAVVLDPSTGAPKVIEGLRAEARRPFAPLHGPGDDPYVLHEYSTDEQRRTSFQGARNPEAPPA